MKIVNLATLLLVGSTLTYAEDTLSKEVTEHNRVMESLEKSKKVKEEKSEGYSFFKTAVQNITYEERHVYKNDHPAQGIQKGDVQTNDFSGTNFVTIGGNLSPINDKYDFSFETISTLLPQEIDEKWNINGRINQTDKATIDFTQVTFLMHQKYTPQHRAVGGLEFKKLDFERYDFYVLSTGATSNNAIRERTNSLSLDAGYWYESKNVGKKGWHYNAKALVKVPLWQDTTNTASPEVTFSDPSGYDVDMEVGASYAILPNIDLGLMAGYNYIYRNGESKDGVHWPENTFQAYTLGFTFMWNL